MTENITITSSKVELERAAKLIDGLFDELIYETENGTYEEFTAAKFAFNAALDMLHALGYGHKVRPNGESIVYRVL